MFKNNTRSNLLRELLSSFPLNSDFLFKIRFKNKIKNILKLCYLLISSLARSYQLAKKPDGTDGKFVRIKAYKQNLLLSDCLIGEISKSDRIVKITVKKTDNNLLYL